MTHTVIEMPQEEPTPVARVNVQRTWAFPGFWKSKSTEEEPTATRAHMGESNNGQAYYDENLKQWVWTNDQNNGTSQSQGSSTLVTAANKASSGTTCEWLLYTTYIPHT